MKRYHLNYKGLPGVCNAQRGKCPFGGEEAHTNAAGIKEARVWAEKRIAEEYDGGIFGVTRKNADTLIGAGILGYHQADEHIEHRGKYYGYVALQLTSRPEPVYVPQDTKGKLVNSTEIWGFIKEIPQELFEEKEALEVLEKCIKSAIHWRAH